MREFVVLFSIFTATVYYGNAKTIYSHSPRDHDKFLLQELRIRRDISDECLPVPPPAPPSHHHPRHLDGTGRTPLICCELPTVVPIPPEIWSKCRETINGMLPPGGSQKLHKRALRQNDNDRKRVTEENHDDVHPVSPSLPSSQYFQEKKECFIGCIFNMSGLLSADDMLNEETLNQKLIEETANDTKWASTIEPIFKKCIAAAKEANSQSQKTCRPGPDEYIKCMTRELFFNCPSDIWVNSAECNELKNKLEKCPNLAPPHLFPSRRDHAIDRISG